MSRDVHKQYTPLQPYRVRAYCAECGGELKFKGVMLPTDPPQYKHVCEESEWGGCDYTVNLWEQYPRIEYREL